MKLKLISTPLAAFAGLFMTTALSSAADCDDIGSKVKASIEKAPETLLVVVDKMVSKNEACACEIVKAAIEASRADKKLVRDIVVTAVSAANGMAATIAECALAAAPEAATEIRAGLSEVFEGAESGGKNVMENGKNVVVDESDDFGAAPVAVSGVYLIAPIAPSAASFQDPQVLARQLGISLALAKEIIRTGDTLVEVLNRRKRPSRDDNRDGEDDSTPSVQTP